MEQTTPSTTVPVEEAAQRIGISVEAMKQALIQQRVDFGFAIPFKRENGTVSSWRFVVLRERLEAYATARDYGPTG